MTREEAIEILEEVKTLDDSMFAYNRAYNDAMNMAIDALKAQEPRAPRVMTLKEVLENAQKIGFPCWVEDHIDEDIGPILFPAVITSDDTYIQYTGNDYYEGAIYHWAYNKRLRCWTSRPTDEQREAEVWNN